MARPDSGTDLPLSVPRPRPGPWLSGASSMMVFQAPQAVQVKAVIGLAMGRYVADCAAGRHGAGAAGRRGRMDI